MTNDLLEEMHRIGALRFPNEACGFVVKTQKDKSALIESRNDSPYPNSEFLINPDEYLRAEELGEIIGVWHTHTNGNIEPSDADLASCEATGVTWYMCNVSKKPDGSFGYSPLRVFSPHGYQKEYVGRPYVFGVFDCWTLCRDYYKREFGIELNDYPRIEDYWLKPDLNFFATKWEETGLVDASGQDFQRGDILFFQTDNSGNPNHSAIYIGDGLILHHCYARLSRREMYGGYWLKHTVKHLRHKNNVS